LAFKVQLHIFKKIKVMKNKALEMIKEGYSIEIVMDVLGLEPDELLDIVNGALGIKVFAVECVSQVIESELIDRFEINMN